MKNRIQRMHTFSRLLPLQALSVALLSLASEPSALGEPLSASGSTAHESEVRQASLWRDEWPKFRVSEGVLTGVAAVGTAVIVAVGPAQHPRWTGGILFDDAVRDEVRATDPETRAAYRTVGDYTYRLSPVLPLFDVLVVSTVGHRDGKLAVNLGLVTLEAYSYAGLSAFVTTESSARARPDSGCRSTACKADTQSFFSGHATISATAAGLLCANHTHMPLWGNPVADGAACALGAVNALATATTRVVADRHYATDVMVGVGMGFGIGYAVPVLLHYSSSGAARTIAVGPDPSCGGNCISVSGSF